MSKLSSEQQRSWLVKNYFYDPQRTITLKPAESLLHYGQLNNRLYYLHSGSVRGFDDERDSNGKWITKLIIGAGNFLGLHSFFSPESTCHLTLEAETDCKLTYIDRDQPVISPAKTQSLAEQFMPVVIKSMVYRQQYMHDLGRQKELAYNQIHEYERLASLGQLSAGVAHELNNSLAVIVRGCEWLNTATEQSFAEKGILQKESFGNGKDKGRLLSSRQVRQQKKLLARQYKLNDTDAESLAMMGLKYISPEVLDNLSELTLLWEIGATMHDLKMASNHATHVVNSMKTLGAKHETKEENVDINETILEAVTLMHGLLRKVHLDLDLKAQKTIYANRGGLVQIWVNLITNAVEACADNETIDPATILIRSREFDSQLFVEVIDNGPGIAQEMLATIFQPNVTTKKSELSFGLGLGLTIVQRIVNEHQGKISVDSTTENTVLRVEFST